MTQEETFQQQRVTLPVRYKETAMAYPEPTQDSPHAPHHASRYTLDQLLTLDYPGTTDFKTLTPLTQQQQIFNSPFQKTIASARDYTLQDGFPTLLSPDNNFDPKTTNATNATNARIGQDRQQDHPARLFRANLLPSTLPPPPILGRKPDPQPSSKPKDPIGPDRPQQHQQQHPRQRNGRKQRMDFEQLFNSFPLAPFAPTGALGGAGEAQDLSHPNLVGGGEIDAVKEKDGSMTGTGVMTLENANEIAAVAFELAGMGGGSDGGCAGLMDGMDVRRKNDDDDDNDVGNKMYEGQALGGEGKMEDYSAFFNFGESDVQPVPPPVDEPFDLQALLGDTNGEFSQAALASAVTSLYTTFSTPAIAPWSTQTQLCSDFEDIEQASPDPVFGQMFPDQTPAVTTYGNVDPTPLPLVGRSDSFGSEPAFDDVDGSAAIEQGMFGLPLFGGMPAGIPVQGGSEKPFEQPTGAQGDHYGPLSPSHALRLAGTVSPQDATLDMFAATYGTGGTASPRNLFLPTPSALPPHMSRKTSDERSPSLPPSPLVEVEQDFTRDAESGKSRKPSLTGFNNKSKKKPYAGPTGTRKSSRPLLDADAPTMTKSYVAPGATTRKLIPAGFQKKLKLQSDTMGDAVLPETMGEDDQQGLLGEIEEKRRRNCVAARESRRRKQEYQNGLKDEIRGWRSWAEEVQTKLREMGLEHVLEGVGAFVPAPMDLDE